MPDYHGLVAQWEIILHIIEVISLLRSKNRKYSTKKYSVLDPVRDGWGKMLTITIHT